MGYNREQGKTLSLKDALDRLIPIMREFKHVTGDWGRGGEWTQKYGRLVPFQTSSIQGQAVFYRNLKNNPKLIIPRVLSYITLPSSDVLVVDQRRGVVGRADHHGQDDQVVCPELSDEDVLVGIPKPHEIGFLFSSAFRSLSSTPGIGSIRRRRKEFFQLSSCSTPIPRRSPDFAAWDMAGAASNVMMPPVLPVPLEMGVEQALNWHLYFERPIEPQWMRLKAQGRALRTVHRQGGYRPRRGSPTCLPTASNTSYAPSPAR